MSDPTAYLWLIPVLPLAAAIINLFLAVAGTPELRKLAHWPSILAVIGSCVLSVLVLTSLPSGDPSPTVWKMYYTWFQTGEVNVGFTLRADSLTAFMLVTVTFIGSLITIYSVGYMHDDEGYARFFAEVSLFVFAMTGLVLADNFLLLFAFWEGVGVCSYLLIGHYYAKPSAAAAARKAFLVTRIGDIGLILGIILLWTGFRDGDGRTLFALDYQMVFDNVRNQPPGLRVVVCLLLFCGAVGKSAQFPLHVWLPDAMEGPTPVSALIHAATMVTAGVYLVARCTPLFQSAPAAQLVVAVIGGFTALLAALIALTQNDLKRVLAYSTISQLGYMFLALGSGAVVAGVFHLFTHAFFKALLFLAAGSVMHAMGGIIDMRRFSGLRKLLPVTHATFLCGALALAAVPFISSGFWSKDEIFAGVLKASQTRPQGWVYTLLFVAALVTAGLTAFYTFRGYFLTFWGEEKVPHEAGHHAHESPRVMTLPLCVLAVGALAVGYLNAAPFTHGIEHFLNRTSELHHATHPEPVNWGRTGLLWLGSAAFALGGIAGAWWLYLRQRGASARFAADMPGLYQLSLNKFYLDELYGAFIVGPMTALAQLSRIVDFLIDSMVDLIGRLPSLLGQLFRPVQNGLVQWYALAMVLTLMVFLLALARSF